MYTIQTAATIAGRGTVITIAPPIERIQAGDPVRLNGATVGKVCALEMARHPHHSNNQPCLSLLITEPVEVGDTIEFPKSQCWH